MLRTGAVGNGPNEFSAKRVSSFASDIKNKQNENVTRSLSRNRSESKTNNGTSETIRHMSEVKGRT